MKKVYLGFNVVFLVVLVFFTNSNSQDTQEQFTPLTKLNWNISTAKESYYPFEPILFKFKIANNTILPVKASYTPVIIDDYIPNLIPFPARFSLELNVFHDGTKTKFEQLSFTTEDVMNLPIVTTWTEPEATPNKSNEEPKDRRFIQKLKVLDPSEAVEVTRIQNFMPLKMFPTSGEYELAFKIFTNDGEVPQANTNKISITILEPKGIDAKAFEYIKKHSGQNPANAFSGIKSQKERQEVLETFVSKFSGSYYSDYATFDLAQNYMYEKEYVKAEELFNRLKYKPDFIYSKVALDSLGEINRYLRPNNGVKQPQ
jgi:hypothetical protein